MASKVEFSNVSKCTDKIKCFTISIAADTDGSVTEVTTPFNIDGYIILVEVIPDKTLPPTTEYAMELKSSNGVDIMGTALSELSSTVSSQQMPLFGTDFFAPRFVSGPLTISLTDNSVNGGKTTAIIYIKDI